MVKETHKIKRLGLSLAEVLIVIGLLSLSFGLWTLSEGAQDEGAELVATLLAGELRAARKTAQAQGFPVAVAFPTASGSRGHSQSLVRLEGHHRPRMVRVVDTSARAPGSQIFFGLVQPGNLEADPDRSDLNGTEFSLATWEPPDGLEVLVFLPSGTLVSSSPFRDGQREIVCADGVEYSGRQVAGVDTFVLTTAANPFTVTITQAGEIGLRKGLPEGASVTLQEPFPPSLGAPVAPALLTTANQAPAATSSFHPAPVASTLPAGASGTVKLGGFVSLRLEATDADGDQLLAHWSCPEGGAFNFEEPVPMEWHPQEAVWRSLHQWYPPPDAEAGDLFTLEYEVFDGRGGQTTGRVGLTGVVQVLPEGRILFQGRLNGNAEICVINADGSDLTNLTQHPAGDREPIWSPDGSQIAFWSDRAGNPRLYLMKGDGTHLEELLDPQAFGITHVVEAPSFDPSGTLLTFLGRQGGHWEVFVLSLDGSDPGIGILPTDGVLSSHNGKELRQLGQSGIEGGWTTIQLTDPSWHPSGDWLVAAGGPTVPTSSGHSPTQLFVFEVATNNWTKIYESPGGFVLWPQFHPIDRDTLYFRSSSETRNYAKAIVDFTGATPTLGPTTAVSAAGSNFSPDGQFCVNEPWTDLVISKPDGSGKQTLVTAPIPNGEGGASWAYTY